MIEIEGAFLGVENRSAGQTSPTFRILPFGLEKTVTFGSGTANGPSALLAASQEVELFDMEHGCEPCSLFNFHTAEATEIPHKLEDALATLTDLVGQAVDNEYIPFTIGGEHSLTPAAVKPLAQKLDRLTVVQFDAHSDLRDGYEGEHNSHASAMRRCLDHPNVDVIGLGIRNMGIEEHEYLKSAERVQVFPAMNSDWKALAEQLRQELAGRNVYITFDVDGLDPSIMPATGTPEPGGLEWQPTLLLLRAVCESANIVGVDVVELAPIQGMHSPDFIAAQLVYKIMSYTALNAGEMSV